MLKKSRLLDPASSDDGSDSDDLQSFTHKFVSHMSTAKKSTNLKNKSGNESGDTSDCDSDVDDLGKHQSSSVHKTSDSKPHRKTRTRLNQSHSTAEHEESSSSENEESEKKPERTNMKEGNDDSDVSEESGVNAEEASDDSIEPVDDSFDPSDESTEPDDNDDKSEDINKSGEGGDIGKTETNKVHKLKTKKTIEQEFAKLREELADLPFEKLQQLKEKIGVKAYNEAMFGRQKSKTANEFKRLNKNRPVEISSKKPTSKYREVFHIKKKFHRDPRFDDLSGKYDETIFKYNYAFLDKFKQQEKKTMMHQYKKEQDPEKKKQLEHFLKRLKQQEKSEAEREIKQQRQMQRKKKEIELVKQGKKPFYLKKADAKKLELAEMYKKLKKSGKVDNYLAKRRKKTASKDRRHLPKKE